MNPISFNGYNLYIKPLGENKWGVDIGQSDFAFILSEYEYRLIPEIPMPARNHISGERITKLLGELDIFMWGYINAEMVREDNVGNKVMDKAADIISEREDEEADEDLAAEMALDFPNMELSEMWKEESYDDPDQRLESEKGW